MAYKASSRKTAAKKPVEKKPVKTAKKPDKPEKSLPEKTPAADAGVAAASIDDFIGAPVLNQQDEPQQIKEQKPAAESPAEEQGQRRQQSYTDRGRDPLRSGETSRGPRRDFRRSGRFGGYRDDQLRRIGSEASRGGSDRFGRDFRRVAPVSHGGTWRDPLRRSNSETSRPRSGFGNDSHWGQGEQNVPYTQDINVPTETVRGVLDAAQDGHGFLRPKYAPSERDVYISQSQIRRFLLRNGDMVEGQARPPKDNERYWGLLKVEKVNDLPAEQMQSRPRFEDLVPVYPNKLLSLETGQTPYSTRIIDLLAPIGFGQRGLVVSPPKAGKTTILKEIAAGISENYPQVHLMAVLIGERPEEVTDITRSVKGEVYASNFDESPEHQTRVAEVALDRAKRLIEMGHDVVILLDSITRLARAYNLVVNPSGRTLTGGFDPAALYPAKKFLGAARCNEPFETPEEVAKKGSEEKPVVARVTDGGSLTIIGTALVETGSRMDDLIYEEFKGTGNMELHLSRSLQERRIFPAIDAGKSGTRHDELLLGEDNMKLVTTLRHMLTLLSDEERTMMLIDRLSKTTKNEEFLQSLSQG